MAIAPVVRHKHVRIDRAKLQKSKRLVNALADTEALDRAPDLAVSEGEIDETLHRIGGKGV